MKKEIVVKFGMVRELAQAFNVCEKTVYNALRGLTGSKKSAAIRQLATEKMKEYNQQ